MTIIAVANEKGGIGKTTISFNLAKFLAKKKKRVLAIDNDSQGNLTKAFLEEPADHESDVLKVYQEDEVEPVTVDKNIDLLGSGAALAKLSKGEFDVVFRLKEYLAERKKGYDYVIIDCLPGLGHKLLAALNASDYVLIPTKPAPFALLGLTRLMDTIVKTQARMNSDLEIAGIVLNLMEDKTVIHSQLEESIRQEYGVSVFKNKISKGIKIEESPFFQQSIMEYAPKSKQAQQFTKFFNELLKRIK